MDNKQIENLINETLPNLAADMAEEMVEVLTKTLHGGKDSLNLDTIYNMGMYKIFICCVSYFTSFAFDKNVGFSIILDSKPQSPIISGIVKFRIQSEIMR